MPQFWMGEEGPEFFEAPAGHVIPHDRPDVARSQGRWFYFWKFVHNAILHPLLSLPWEPKWAERAHDWTAERCYGAG